MDHRRTPTLHWLARIAILAALAFAFAPDHSREVEAMGAGSCPNGSCGGSEDCTTCPADCGACPPVCGNSSCEAGETCSNCDTDCGACPAVCGDGTCDATETCSSCAGDCGACPPVCGDATCNGTETCTTCPGDCGACCGDALCEGAMGESCATCAADCGACVCGDGICSATETCGSCAADCGACAACGNSVCDATENCSTCAGDCGACASCGDGTCNGTETCGSCPGDCGACVSCGDGTCGGTEDCSSCAADCGACSSSGDFASCPYDLSACGGEDANDCCYKSFPRGSIIIPMDRCHQTPANNGAPTAANSFCSDPGSSDDGMFHAYGLVYRAMQNDIPVYWVINPTKDPTAVVGSTDTYTDRDIDFWVLSSGATAPTVGGSLSNLAVGDTPPVLRLNNANLNTVAGSYTKKQFPVRGGAFVIDAADRSEFDALFLRTGAYSGFAGNSKYDFSLVDMYEVQTGADVVYHDFRGASGPYAVFNGGNSAPVAVTLDYEPPRLARETPAGVSSAWLAAAKLDDPAASPGCKSGTWTPSTAVYCDLTNSDMEAGYLISGGFDYAWLDRWNAQAGTCGSAAAQAMAQQLDDFMTAIPGTKNGNSVMFMGSAMDLIEQCNERPLGNPGGLSDVNQKPDEPMIIRYPANLFSQTADIPPGFAAGSSGAKWDYITNGYQSFGSLTRLMTEDRGTLCSYHKSTAACDSFSATGDNVDFASYARHKDVAANGIAFYLGGRQITQAGNQAHLRMVLNAFLALPAGNVDSLATTETITEVTRATPIVGSVDGTETLFQGTVSIITPARTVTSYTGAADDSKFEFPHFTGHMRAIDVTNLSGTETTFDTLPAIFNAADGIPAVNTAGCGSSAFTSACRTVFTNVTTGLNTSPAARPQVVSFDTGNLATLKPLLQANGASFTDAEATTLISRVLAGRDDDDDGIYEAALGGVNRSTVAVVTENPIIGVARPAIVYFGGLDGMIHAVCAEVQSPCTYKGQELWAFIPRENLPLLRRNEQSIEGSITVDDVFGDFDGTGVREFRTILTFQLGNTANTPGLDGEQPAVYALDVTDPKAPQVLWEVSTPTTRGAFEFGLGLNTAMGNTRVGNNITNITYAQTNNGGTGGAGFVILALNSTTGEEVWRMQHAYADPRDDATDSTPAPSLPATGVPMGVAAFDSRGSGNITHVLASSLYGDVWLVNAADGNNDIAAPLFRFTKDLRPIGATVALLRDKTSGKLIAVAGSGGYTDPGNNLTWSPNPDSNGNAVDQYVVGIEIDGAVAAGDAGTTFATITETAGATFVINLGPGNRVFAQPTVAGNELFVVTDSTNINDVSFGLSGTSTGSVNRYGLDSGTPLLLNSAIGGGAGSVAINKATGTIYSASGKSAKATSIVNFDDQGADITVGTTEGATRLLWLRLR